MSPINQPGVMSAQSPLGNTAQQSNMMQMSAQSPLGNPGQQTNMMQMSVQSPMQAPSPLMAQSPIPNAILQSPGNPNMSPYNSQPSPRIGTPHSQPDEVSLSVIFKNICFFFVPDDIVIFNVSLFNVANANKCTSNEPIQSRRSDEVNRKHQFANANCNEL